jgi:hypothetical protein
MDLSFFVAIRTRHFQEDLTEKWCGLRKVALLWSDGAV